MSEPEQVPASAPDAPGPSSDEFDPNLHIWDGTTWWSLDRGRRWDGTRWQVTGSGDDLYLRWLAWVRSNLGAHGKLAPIAASAALGAVRNGAADAEAADAARTAWTQAASRFGPRYGRAHRATTAVAHASVLALLASPFLVLSTCGGDVDVSGYQTLAGFDFPASQLGSDVAGPVPHFGPNVALALLIVAVLVGVASSWFPGRRAALVRLGTAAFGVIMVVVAASGMPSSIDFGGLTANVGGGIGTLAIPLALAVSFVVDGQALLRSQRTDPIPKDDAPGP